MTGILKLMVLGLLAMIVGIIAFAAGFGSNYFWTARRAPLASAATGVPPKFGLMWESWGLIKDEFYGDIPDKPALVHGMIRGLLQSLQDPYTILVEPQPAQLEANNLQGTYGGIGAKVESRKGRLVLLPFPDGPANDAGVLANDEIVEIDAVEIKPDMTPDDAETKLRGPVGTKVKLTLHRIGNPNPVRVELTRQEINIPTVQYRMLENTQYAYVQITLESGDTSKEFERALNELKAKNPKGIIVDLRNNPGGLFPDPALDIVGQFLPNAPVVVERRVRDGSNTTYNARNGAQLRDIPFVVLVNGGTASAAEIMAGAFQDSGKTALIGEKTFGKGSVQGIYPLSDKSVLHVTTAKWLTPKGREIDGVGLTPDVQIPLTPEDTAKGVDPQLDRAVAYLTNGK